MGECARLCMPVCGCARRCVSLPGARATACAAARAACCCHGACRQFPCACHACKRAAAGRLAGCRWGRRSRPAGGWGLPPTGVGVWVCGTRSVMIPDPNSRSRMRGAQGRPAPSDGGRSGARHANISAGRAAGRRRRQLAVVPPHAPLMSSRSYRARIPVLRSHRGRRLTQRGGFGLLADQGRMTA